MIVGSEIVGPVIVGVPANVYVPVTVPLSAGEEIVGVPANVYVPVTVPLSVGSVIVGPVIVGVPANVYVPVIDPLNTGAVIVLFVKVSVAVRETSIPVVGSVTLVVPVDVRVTLCPPDVANAPGSVSVPVVSASADPPALTITARFPLPVKEGSLPKPASIKSNSARITDEEPGLPVEGVEPWV